jgi:membrane-associated phospholipid phosphatase
MYNIFYDFGGTNKALFQFINNLANVSIFPHILKIISEFFFIGNFAVYYFVLCLYCYWRLKRQHAVIAPSPKVIASEAKQSQEAYDNHYSKPHEIATPSSKARNDAANSSLLAGDDFSHTYNQLVKVGMCYALFGLAYAAMKFSINLPRPFCSLPASAFTTILDVTNERCLSSFPSAHTGLAIIIAYYLWPYLKNYQKLAALLIIILVALSRITLAMHYPADILYSIIIAFGLIYLNENLFKLLYKNLIRPIGIIISRLIF